MGKIYFRTRAYNAEKTIKRCMDSVLNQTYRREDIVYYIMDNGSTDKTGEIIRAYAEKDKRVKAFYRKKNYVFEPESDREFEEFELKVKDGDYFCALDADDEYSTDMLEKIIPFMEENLLDIAAFGSDFINEQNEVIHKRTAESQMLITSSTDFLNDFVCYYKFVRAVWGKVFNAKALHALLYSIHYYPERFIIGEAIGYGSDTYMVLSALRVTERFGIYPEVMHKYYVNSTSISNRYNRMQTYSDIILYNDALDFLENHGEVSEENQKFLYRVYSNAIIDTVKNIMNSSLSAKEKLYQYSVILARDVTKKAYQINTQPHTDSKSLILEQVMRCMSDVSEEEEIFSNICKEYLSEYPATAINLFKSKPEILSLLVNDKRYTVVQKLNEALDQYPNYDKNNLIAIHSFLSKDNTLLSSISNLEFIYHYNDIYILVLLGKYVLALNFMTSYLQCDKELDETFIRLYLLIAATLQCEEHFVFGKIKQAQFLERENRCDEYNIVLKELEEMGIKL